MVSPSGIRKSKSRGRAILESARGVRIPLSVRSSNPMLARSRRQAAISHVRFPGAQHELVAHFGGIEWRPERLMGTLVTWVDMAGVCRRIASFGGLRAALAQRAPARGLRPDWVFGKNGRTRSIALTAPLWSELAAFRGIAGRGAASITSTPSNFWSRVSRRSWSKQASSQNTRPALREHLFDDLSADIGQAEIAALKAVGQAFVVDPQTVKNCCLEIMNVDRVF